MLDLPPPQIVSLLSEKGIKLPLGDFKGGINIDEAAIARLRYASSILLSRRS